MKHLTLALLLVASVASAQGVYDYFPPPGITYGLGSGLSMGSATGGAQGAGTINAQGLFVNGVAVATGGSPGGATGAIQYNNSGAFGGFVVSGDCTINTTTGIEICLSTNGVLFGTAATINTGTSGATIPLLNGVNTWSAAQSFGGISATSLSSASITDSGITGLIQCVHASSAGLLSGTGSDCGSGGGSSAFGSLTGGTNNAAAMLVGTGASLNPSGTGVINANAVNGATMPVSAALLATNGSSQVVAATLPCAVSSGCTGLSTYALGQLIYASSSSALAGLAGNTTTVKQFYTSTGTGSAAQAPALGPLLAGDISGAVTQIQENFPFILAGNGATLSVGNNCAITGISTLRKTYARAYIWMKAGSIASGSVAGWYPFVGSSATAGTCFNNVYAGGQPTWPGSLTAFATTGAGTYTPTTGTPIVGPTFTLTANTMGANGLLQYDADIWITSSGNNKQAFAVLGSTTTCNMFFVGSAENGGSASAVYINTAGQTNVQTCTTVGPNAAGGAPTDGANDTTTNLTGSISMQVSTATDSMVLEWMKNSVSPHP